MDYGYGGDGMAYHTTYKILYSECATDEPLPELADRVEYKTTRYKQS